MDRPRLFLSAVSEELKSARQAVAATVRTLGFDPVSQDDFPTGYGELRNWLREQIDSCEGLIQLVGHGYGAEPAEVDPDYGRVSYTQFEFLYANTKKKKTWIIVIGDGCRRDKPIDQLDLPREAGHPDPTSYQAERRKLQQGYVGRLVQENHLRHTANNDTELQNIVLRLRDELGELRKRYVRRLTAVVLGIFLCFSAIIVGGYFGYKKLYSKDADFQASTKAQLDKIAEDSRITTEKIRVHLIRTAEETHRRELAESDAIKDWRERQRFRESADNAHAARLIRIEELAASFAEIEGRGTATSVFSEMTRIVAEQGVDEAIAYVSAQRSSIFKAVDDITKTAHERVRVTMQPLLKLAGLHEYKGQAAEARTLYTDILAKEPDWPEALHEAFWFHVNQGDIARVRTTLADARRDYEEAHRIAQRLTAGDPSNTEWQRDLAGSYEKLGNVAVSQGQLEEAAGAYTASLGIVKKLTTGDPSNTQWQFDLGISYERLGDVFLAQGDLPRASDAYLKKHRLIAKLAAGDPSNTDWQRDLSVSFIKLGEVAMAQGQLEEAARAYGGSLGIVKKLAEGDPSNTDWQRDLSVAYGMLGNVAMAQGQLEEAARAYGQTLAVFKKLAEGDPSNTKWQRDLSVSFIKLGEVAMAQGQLEEAARAYGDSLGIVKKLAEGDPSNTDWHRDLSVAYGRLGDVAVAQGQLEEAARAYGDSLGIRKKLAAGDLSNTEWQGDLSVAYGRLGDMAAAQGQLEEAARSYGDSLGIVKKLVAGDPSNTKWQRDLSAVYGRLGDVAAAQGQLEEAARNYGECLAIAKKLAAGDPSNTRWQRDLWVTYWRMADLAEWQDKAAEAKGYWKQAFEVLSGLEKRGLHLSPEDQRWLETLRQKVGAAP